MPEDEHRARDRGEQRQPAEAPGQRAEVVDPAVGVVLAELGRVGLRALAADLPARLGRVEQRERVEHGEQQEARGARQHQAEQRVAQLRAVALHAQAGGDEQREQHRAGRVLRGGRHADRAAGERPVGPPAALVDQQAADQRDGHRRERDDVVQRVLGVEDRQEGDRHDRGGGEADPPLEEARARPVDERDDAGPDQRDDDAPGEERGVVDVRIPPTA